MRILHIITNTELGGAQRVCIDLCRCAVSDGNSVAVASMVGGYLWEQLPEEVMRFPLKNMVKPVSVTKDLAVFFELKRTVRDFCPDIIHLHSSKAGVLGRLVSLRNPRRVVYTVHGFDSIRQKHRVFLPLEKILQHFCGTVVGVSDYDNRGLRAEKIHRNVLTVRNGIAENSITPASALPVIPAEKKVVLSIARIFPQKKIQMFLDVARRLPDFAFVWIGGDTVHSAEELPAVYDAPPNVYLLGDVPNASDYIGLCDLFVLFSNFEGLPMSIIEAMSQKKAVVASDVGGIYELVDDENGRRIQNDVDTACEAIKEILSDDKMRAAMEAASYRKFKAGFTLETMWSGYKEIYERLARDKEDKK